MERPDGSIRISDDLHALLDASPDAVVAVDAAGRIAYANARSPRRSGTPVSSCWANRSSGCCRSASPTSTSHHRTATWPARSLARWASASTSRDGARTARSSRSRSASLPSRRPAGRSSSRPSSTSPRASRSSAQLLQAQKMESIGRLAGGIAHDFNNMLFAIRSYADMLAEDLRATPAARSTADLMPVGATASSTADRPGDSAHRAAARVQPAPGRAARRFVDLNAAVRHVEPMLRRLIGEHVRLVRRS